MRSLKWVVLALALLQGGWLTFDGTRALVVGDYVTASSGPRAGQLGPWSRVVSALGFQPRGTLIKCVHLFLGLGWLTALVLFLIRPEIGWWIMIACAVASLWYLPIGTFASAIILGLMFIPCVRSRVNHGGAEAQR